MQNQGAEHTAPNLLCFVLPFCNLHYEKFADGTVKCIEDEIPFDLPAGWAWVRLKGISFAIQYGLSNSAEQYGTHRLLRITDIQDGKVNWSSVPYTTVKEPDNYLLSKGDIVFARTGATVGKSFLIEEIPFPAVYASYLIRIQLLDDIIPEFIYQFFNSHCYWEQITDKSVGVGQPNVNGTSLKNLLIPLAPMMEQERIIPASRSALKMVTAIDSDTDELLSTITTVKSKILDLAIRGKLVPQDPNDEPASVLLERIRAEKEELIRQGKIKRDKKDSVIFKGEDNSYYAVVDGNSIPIKDITDYDLPTNWHWITLNDIAVVTSGKTPSAEHLNSSHGIPYYKVSDMNAVGNEKYLNITNLFLDATYHGVVFEKGAFVFPKNGGAVLTNKKRILMHRSVVDLNTGVMIVSKLVNLQYAFLLLQTIDFRTLQKGTTIPTVDSKSIGTLIFALPPLAEQQRIVAAVETAFAQLDAIVELLN